MRHTRAALISSTVAACLLICVAPARAASVLVLDGDGVHTVRDSAVPATSLPVPEAGLKRCCAARTSVIASTAATRTDPVKRAIRRALAAGRLSADDAARYRALWSDARSTRRHLPAARAGELGYVIDTLYGIARSKRLAAGRMPALFLTLERNREWWSGKGAPASGARVRFGATKLIFEYYPGHGLQIQPLANFGTANGYWYANKDKSLRALVDELLAVRVIRGGFTTWEYYFDFGGGSPPWMSGMAQGTAVQALARAGTRLADPSLIEVARTGLGAFQARTPVGALVPIGDGGAWYALYSFAPDQRVLNGMLQTLIGLQTYATLSGDPRAAQLFQQGDRIAQERIGAYDTGAWSLYSRSGSGGAGPEANLNYHTLNRDFSRNLCKSTGAQPYCQAADHFNAYLHEAPTLDPFGPAPAPARGGHGVRFNFTLSKVGRVGITVTHKSSAGTRTYLSTSGFFAYGKHYLRWVPPRLHAERTYDYKLFARDLAGNSGSERGTIRVK